MSKRLLRDLRDRLDLLPLCLDYARLIEYAHSTTGIDCDELRCKMGNATYAEWADFLNVA